MPGGAMTTTTYVPPSQRLFKLRHTVTRRELQSGSAGEIDWSTALDVSLGQDSSLILYAVPMLGGVAKGDDGTRNSTISTYSDEELFEPDLRSKLQSNLSLESLIQENKKRISAHHDSLTLINSAGQNAASIKSSARQEITKLRDRNMHLFGRAGVLQELWDTVRRCRDPTLLLIEIGKNGLYWFGIPSDLRPAVYRCCLVPLGDSTARNCVSDAIARCCADDTLATNLYRNMKRSFPFLADPQATLPQADAFEARLASKYPGLHYHLTQTLQMNIIEQFVRPLLVNSFVYALNTHAVDRVGMELLDLVVLAVYHHDLGRLMLDEFLFNVLTQTHFKFFSERLSEVEQQLDEIQFELVDVLEASRRDHGQLIIEQVPT